MPSRVPDGFDQAFEGLYRLAYRVAFRILGDQGDAEDVAQEALARAAVRWTRLEDRPEGWVTRVASNLAIDRYRRRRRRPPQPMTGPVGLVDPHLGERGDLVTALRRLPRRQRQAVVLRYLGDLSEAQVALEMGCSVGAVKSHGTAASPPFGATSPKRPERTGRVFGHLDDPAERSPGESERANVARRVRTIRARRRLGAIGASLLVVVAIAVFLVARPAPAHLASTQTGFQFNALKGPLAIGTPVPTTALVNVVFVDDQTGFALVVHRGRVVLARTSDGGSTWQVQNDNLPHGDGPDGDYPDQFEFQGSDGYLWGEPPTAQGAAPLWTTSDSGVSWRRALIGPAVYDVSAIGTNVWALASSCNVHPVAASSPCPLTLEVSRDAGTTWMATGGAGFAQVMSSPPLAEQVELARITTTRSYVLTMGEPAQSGAMGLVYTSDGGATWQTRPVPCAGAFDLGAEIAASSTQDLWLLCGGQPSAGEQSKELYRSEDGGMSWNLTASTSVLGLSPPSTSQPDALSLNGYIAPYSIGHENLAVASDATAWLYPFRASMYKTVSGGRSWTAVPDLSTAGFDAGGSGNVTFISATQGWICQYGVGLWHTSDGVHWSPLGV